MPTALISVFSKEGIVDFVQDLVDLGWDIFSSGGTAKTLASAGIPVRDVAALVGGGPILGHRVVTLSREVHAGLLATNSAEDTAELERLGIPRIDLVCVDLYPLKEEIANPRSTPGSVIEKTDIGGPTILRSAAKGRRIVVCDPHDRQLVIDELKKGMPDKEVFIAALAAKAEAIVADYCLASASYHSDGAFDGFMGQQVSVCHYGENPWQKPAVLYSVGSDDPLALDKFQLVAGADPSYNNWCDVDRLLQTVTHIVEVFRLNWGTVPLVSVGAKHGDACGAAVSDDSDELQVLRRMLEGDLDAILGGLVITNFHIGETEAEELLGYRVLEGTRRLLDGIIAPSFSEDAIKVLRRKGDKCRFFANPALGSLTLDASPRFRYVRGGFLRQPNYTYILDFRDPRLEKIGQLITPAEEKNLALAWAIASTSNSNTITCCRGDQLIANGVGQQSRVAGCRLAVMRASGAKHNTVGAVACSDSFFPFPDGPAVLAKAGIKAILATSGSVNDQAVKDFCVQGGITLYLIPDSVGRGFYGH